MKKLLRAVLPVKYFAAMIFTGLICAYMVTGGVYGAILHQPFEYAIPFIFILEGLALSLAIAFLWQLIISDAVIKKMRYLPRLVLFLLSLTGLLAVSLLVFIPMPTDWVKLWLAVSGCVTAAVAVMSIAAELYYRATGKRYTEILKDYQATL